MILSHKHKVIFIKTRKTAGTSFEIALSKFCGKDDVITPISTEDEIIREELGFLGPQNYCALNRDGETVDLYNHIDASSLKKVLPIDSWAYSKISILRDPYDYIASTYFWAIRKQSIKPTLTQFLFRNPGVVVKNFNAVKIGNHCILDYFIRYECLKNDVLRIEEKIPSLEGLYDTFRKINAKGGIRPNDASGETARLFKDNPKAKKLVDLLLEDEDLASVPTQAFLADR